MIKKILWHLRHPVKTFWKVMRRLIGQIGIPKEDDV
jgi:hypothetical protein